MKKEENGGGDEKIQELLNEINEYKILTKYYEKKIIKVNNKHKFTDDFILKSDSMKQISRSM